MADNTRPRWGSFLSGIVFVAIGVAAVVAELAAVGAGVAVSIALLIAGTATLLVLLAGLRDRDDDGIADDPLSPPLDLG